MEETLAFVMAGGQGERLRPLTDVRAKPAVPFGGIFRIIDFTLSNCVNSGIRRIYVLTQYKSHSLSNHLKTGWNMLSRRLDQFIDEVPAQQQLGSSWYQGTADAIRQNMQLHRAEAAPARAHPVRRPHLQDGLPAAPELPRREGRQPDGGLCAGAGARRRRGTSA